MWTYITDAPPHMQNWQRIEQLLTAFSQIAQRNFISFLKDRIQISFMLLSEFKRIN